MSQESSSRPDPSKGGRTRQEQQQQTDVNVIVAAHRRGGVTTHLINRVSQFAWVPSMDFRECMEHIRQARELFDELPSQTRKFFENDPRNFVEYASDPKNLDDLVKHGLAIPKPVASPVLGSAENPIHTTSADVGGTAAGS